MVVEKALQIVRESGYESVSARSLGAALGSSSSPIFTLFSGMEEVMEEVRKAGQRLFDDFVSDTIDYVPAFKEFGLRLICFAREEPNLFQLIFLRKDATIIDMQPIVKECMDQMKGVYGLSEEQLSILFKQMWVFGCGLADLSAQEPALYTEKTVSEMITIQFTAVVTLLKSGRPIVNVEPRRRRPGESVVLDM